DFSDAVVAEETIEQIQETIVHTANASNRQSYSVLVLDKKKAGTLGMPGSHVFVFCVDFHRLNNLALALNRTFDSGYFMQFVTAVIDVSLLAQSAVIAARSLGVDTFLTNELYHRSVEKSCSEFRLPPKRVFPMIAVCLGYAKERPGRKKGRLTSATVFHRNVYREIGADGVQSLIGEYDDPDRNLTLNSAWKQKGYFHYLEWFFDEWTPAVGSRKQSGKMLEELRKRALMDDPFQPPTE
ncbi:MAG TPA: hypothetical protein VGB38_03980, partial [bacterium]